MIKVLPFVFELALLVFCVIDAIQTPDVDVRNMPKWAWILLILVFPLVGGIAWLVAGRPTRTRASGWAPGSGSPKPEPPRAQQNDIDQRLEADLARLDREQEDSLRKWEAELRERENRLRNDGDNVPPM
jgi:hypothetical protein